LLSMSLPPCCRYHPAGVVCRLGQSATLYAAFAQMLRAQPPVQYYEATYAFICITARRLAHRPRGGFVIGL